MTESVYPWMHLFEEEISSAELPVIDTTDLKEQVKIKESEASGLHDKLESQFALLQEQTKQLSIQQHKLNEIKDVSNRTFDRLNATIDTLKEENRLLRQEVEKHSPFDELIYPILVQSIISHKSGTNPEKKQKQTLNSTLRWLQQRRNVIKYLQCHNMHLDRIEHLEKLLYIDEARLRDLLYKLKI